MDVGLSYPTLQRDGIWHVYLSLFLSHPPLARMQRPYMVVGGRHGDSEMRGGGGNAHASTHPIFGSARLASARLGASAHAPRAVRSVDLRIP